MTYEREKVLEREIEQSERMLDLKRQELELLRSIRGESPPPSEEDVGPKRFFGMRPIDAMRILLLERGEPIEQEELTRILIKNGAFHVQDEDGTWRMKKAPEKMAIQSYDKNIRLGSIRREGTKIVLLKASRYAEPVE